MKTRYRFIHFAPMTDSYWTIHNNKRDAIIGNVEYYESWKKFVSAFNETTILDSSCLRDIAHFLDQLNKEKP